MALPKLQHPTTNVIIPSFGKTIKLRPFTVREEKLLLMARADKEATLETVVDAIRQLLTNCIIDDVDVDEFTLYDFEWLFINLRSVSVNEIIEFGVKDTKDPVELNLREIKPDLTERSPEVNIGGGVRLVLSDIKIKDLSTLGTLSSGADDEALTKILSLTLVKMYDEKSVYVKGDDFNDADLNDFVQNLTGQARDKIVAWYDSAPKLSHTIKYTDDIGYEHEIVLKGLVDFFTLAPATAT